jgi:DNA repair protein RAD16
VLDLLTRLRKAINHPYLVVYSQREHERTLAANERAATAPSAGGVCGLCFEDADDCILTGCGHPFCRGCMRDYIEALDPNAASLCPTCNVALSVDLSSPPAAASASGAATYTAASSGGGGGGGGGGLVGAAGRAKRGILSRIELSRFVSSTKIEALMEELHLMRLSDPSAKAIIFSQYVSFLDLLEHRLLLGGIRVVKLNGGMTATAREAVLKMYREDPEVTAILISLKAGGVALNLTVASHIYLMDPWWNPAAEYQAIDRAHRLGQHKPIRAVRFVVRNTVEERILRLQDKKRLVFEGTVGGDAAALGQLSEEDLKFLFQN